MTDFKFKQHLPKSVATSNISNFESVFGDQNNIQEEATKFDFEAEEAISDLDVQEDIQQNFEEFKTEFGIVENENLKRHKILQKFSVQCDSQKKKQLSNSQSLQMSKSRTKDELTPENFTDNTIQVLQTINKLLNLSLDQQITEYNKRMHRRLKKKINDLRIFRKHFSFNIQLGLQSVIPYEMHDLTTLKNQIYINHQSYINRFILDLDYYRQQSICENDQFAFKSICSVNNNQLVLSNDQQQIVIYDIAKSRLKDASITLNSGLDPSFSKPIDIKQNMWVYFYNLKQILYFQNKDYFQPSPSSPICINYFILNPHITAIQNIHHNENTLLVGTDNGLVNIFDIRQNQINCAWKNLSKLEENSIVNFDSHNNQVLVAYPNEFLVFDQRKMNEIVYCQPIDSILKKAQFTLNDGNIAFFCENSKEINFYNENKNKLLCQKTIHNSIISDTLFKENTQDLLVLSNENIDELRVKSFLTIYDNKSSNIRQKDQVSIVSVKPLNYLQQDKNQEFIYTISPQFLRVWKYTSQDELQMIKKNLLEIAN